MQKFYTIFPSVAPNYHAPSVSLLSFFFSFYVNSEDIFINFYMGNFRLQHLHFPHHLLTLHITISRAPSGWVPHLQHFLQNIDEYFPPWQQLIVYSRWQSSFLFPCSFLLFILKILFINFLSLAARVLLPVQVSSSCVLPVTSSLWSVDHCRGSSCR